MQKLTLLTLAIALAAPLACGGPAPTLVPQSTPTPAPSATVVPALTATPDPATLPPDATVDRQGVPPAIAMPFIFSGRYFVDGKPGPAGQKMFGRIGRAESLTTTTAGGYANIILGPAFPEDQVGDINFFLGEPGGKVVQAQESYTFRMVAEPTGVYLDLNFPSLP